MTHNLQIVGLIEGGDGKVRAMKAKTVLLGAMLAATIPTMAVQNHFVIFDNLLRVPALCYPLPAGWTGMGWVRWNVPARSNSTRGRTP